MTVLKMLLSTEDSKCEVVDVYDINQSCSGKVTALIWYNNSWKIVDINNLEPLKKLNKLNEGTH